MFARKRIACLLVFVALLTGCAGCAGAPENAPEEPPAGASEPPAGAPEQPAEGPIIGFAQLGEESAWRIANTQSLLQAGEDAGLQVMYKNAQQDQSEQIKAIRSFIAYKVDAIVFAPIVETGWDVVLQEAKDSGIPVILEDRRVKGSAESLVTAWVGSDFEWAGDKAAQFLKKKMTGESGPINIVELMGTANSTAAEQRHRAFWNELAGDARFCILHSEAGDFMISKGREVMRKVLEKNDPNTIDVVYSHNDDMTLGAIEAIEEAGLTPGEDIVIITVDAQQKIIDLLKQGKVNCAIECNPYIGEQVFSVVSDVLAGKPVDNQTYAEETCFTEYDDLDDLAPRGY